MKVSVCDICGSPNNVEEYVLPVFRTHDSCDGKTFYPKPIITLQKMDICEECLEKVTMIVDDSVMGYGKLSIIDNAAKA